MTRVIVRLLLLGVVALLAACSEDEKAPLDPGESSTLPESAAALMADFRAAYEARDESGLERLLHPAAQVFLLDETIQAYEQGGHALGFDRLNHDALVTTHQNLFSEVIGAGPTGQVLPPVVSIEVEYLVQDGGWEPYLDVGGNFPGLQVQQGLFHLLFYFNGPDNGRLEVLCDAEFLAVENEEASEWQLVGWRDLSPLGKAQATEPVMLSTIMAMYH